MCACLARAGIKLSWYLGVKQWDIVHLVCPSNIGWSVLPVAAWRRIPIYVSHHVDMRYYIYEYVKFKLLADIGYALYRFISASPRKPAHARHVPRANCAPHRRRPCHRSRRSSTRRRPTLTGGVCASRLVCPSDLPFGLAGPGERRADTDLP